MAQKKSTMFVKFLKSFVLYGEDVSPKDTAEAAKELPINDARLLIANKQAVEVDPNQTSKKKG